MTFNDIVIVSHPTPEDPQINEDEDQSIPWHVAIRDLFEENRYGQVCSGIYHNKVELSNKLI